MSRALERLWYGAAPGPWGWPLAAPAAVFRAGVALRAGLFDSGVLRSHRIDGARVVSVGNLNVGGAGKTPAVIYLARRALAAGKRVAVLTRGFGRRSSADVVLAPGAPQMPAEECGDEPRLIAASCPGCAVLVGADRVRLARRARDELGAELLLLDDGFQHRRLSRDGDIVVVDQAVGFGNGHLLPWGPLREPLSALARATLIWLRAADRPCPLPVFAQPVVHVRYAATDLLAPDGQTLALAQLAGRPVVALTAIARPGSFLRTLADLGASVVAEHCFGDHHVFTPPELALVAQSAARAGAWVCTTEKDAARLPPGTSAYVVRLGVEVLDGAPQIDAALGL